MAMNWLNQLGSIGSAAGGIGALIGGAGSIFGLISAESERKRALEAQQAAIRQYQAATDAAYQQTLASGGQNIYSFTGLGADALRNLGSSMGSALAAGGVYNPSAVGGALALQQRDTASSLADLVNRQAQAAAQMRAQSAQNVANMQLGIAGGAVDRGYSGVSNALGGLGSFMQSLSSLAPNQNTGTGNNVAAQYGFGTPGYTDPAINQQITSAINTDSPLPLTRGAAVPTGLGLSSALQPFDWSGMGEKMGATALGQSGANVYRAGLPVQNGTINQMWGMPGVKPAWSINLQPQQNRPRGFNYINPYGGR